MSWFIYLYARSWHALYCLGSLSISLSLSLRGAAASSGLAGKKCLREWNVFFSPLPLWCLCSVLQKGSCWVGLYLKSVVQIRMLRFCSGHMQIKKSIFYLVHAFTKHNKCLCKCIIMHELKPKECNEVLQELQVALIYAMSQFYGFTINNAAYAECSNLCDFLCELC